MDKKYVLGGWREEGVEGKKMRLVWESQDEDQWKEPSEGGGNMGTGRGGKGKM